MAELRDQQLQFANHLRNPAQFPAPQGVEERRMQVYRNLFFNSIANLLSGAFPVIRSILDDAQWQALVRDFYTEHRCETPLFPWIAGEFAEYLLNERSKSEDYLFLAELAHYEWSEIALRHTADDAEIPARVGDKSVLSPRCWMLSYHYPVHRIGKDFLPQQKEGYPVCLLMYCNQNDEVKFVESNPATFRLLQLLMDNELTNTDAVTAQLAKEIQPENVAIFLKHLQETRVHLQSLGILLA